MLKVNQGWFSSLHKSPMCSFTLPDVFKLALNRHPSQDFGFHPYASRFHLPRHLYRLQTKFAKVMFLQASVHRGACVAGDMAGGCVWLGDVHGRGMCVAGGCAWQGDMHGRGGMCGGACMAGGHVWQILRDTVNERALRILLECILVLHHITLTSALHIIQFGVYSILYLTSEVMIEEYFFVKLSCQKQ